MDCVHYFELVKYLNFTRLILSQHFEFFIDSEIKDKQGILIIKMYQKWNEEF